MESITLRVTRILDRSVNGGTFKLFELMLESSDRSHAIFTKNQKVATPKGFVAVKDLKSGDEISVTIDTID